MMNFFIRNFLLRFLSARATPRRVVTTALDGRTNVAQRATKKWSHGEIGSQQARGWIPVREAGRAAGLYWLL
ncbi:MAG TPA: hypothetical protein VF147_04300 [Vicinamibacterales bacterium]